MRIQFRSTILYIEQNVRKVHGPKRKKFNWLNISLLFSKHSHLYRVKFKIVLTACLNLAAVVIWMLLLLIAATVCVIRPVACLLVWWKNAIASNQFSTRQVSHARNSTKPATAYIITRILRTTYIRLLFRHTIQTQSHTHTHKHTHTQLKWLWSIQMKHLKQQIGVSTSQ